MRWRKNAGHCWDFSASPVLRHPKHCAPAPVITVRHFTITCAAVKFSEPWMLNHFSELTDHSYVASVMRPECPAKDWRCEFCWLNTRESGPEIVQGLVGVTTSPTLLGPVLLWSQQNYLKLLLTVRYSKSPYDCCPATLPRGKAGMKMNEMNNIFLIQFIHRCLKVLS